MAPFRRAVTLKACFYTHTPGCFNEHMRFLEEAYEFKGGRNISTCCLDAQADTRGVLVPIHELAGLPLRHLEADKGFSTAY